MFPTVFSAHLQCISIFDRLRFCSHLITNNASQEIGFRRVRNANVLVMIQKIIRFVFVCRATFSRIVVSFKDDVFVPMFRVENYGWADILSYIGGYCTLLMGCSLISVIELLYYFTIRVYFTYRNTHNAPQNVAQVYPYLP